MYRRKQPSSYENFAARAVDHSESKTKFGNGPKSVAIKTFDTKITIMAVNDEWLNHDYKLPELSATRRNGDHFQTLM